MEFVILLRLVSVMKLILILSHPLNIQGEKTYFYRFCKKKNQKKRENYDVGLYSNIYLPLSFKLGLMIETTMLCILISVWKTLTFPQGQSSIKNKKSFDVHFLAYLIIDLEFG